MLVRLRRSAFFDEVSYGSADSLFFAFGLRQWVPLLSIALLRVGKLVASAEGAPPVQHLTGVGAKTMDSQSTATSATYPGGKLWITLAARSDIKMTRGSV